MDTAQSGTGPFTVDTSRLPPDAIVNRVDDTGPGGNPVVTITVNPAYHVRVMLVPATQP